MKRFFPILTAGAAVAVLSACSGMGQMGGMNKTAGMGGMMETPMVPAAIAVPAGNKPVMKTVGIGELTYECRPKAGMAGAFEWVFAGPDAVLYDMNRKAVGKYYGGPTWEAMDGSKVTGKQLAVSPGPTGAIPLQLVQAAPSMGTGMMNNVTYIQRLNTVGGVAPTDMCGASNAGAKKTVKYQADYVYYKAS